MKAAILGWGSLIWDERPEFDQWHDGWLPDGPNLNLEFSRISVSRGGALTLVIDDKFGTGCTVAYALSKRSNPDDVICDLRSREGTTSNKIGFYFSDNSRVFKPSVPHNIKAWAEEEKLDLVVWTALSSNFESERKRPFSIPEAQIYLKSLTREQKVKAAEYIWRAPDFVQTPLRKTLEIEPWFDFPSPAQAALD